MAKGEVCKTFIQRFDSARRLHHSYLSFPRLVVPVLVIAAGLSSATTAMGLAAATKSGIVVSVDAPGRRIVLRHGQTETAYHVPESAVVMVARAACGLDRLEVGASVTIRYRIEASEPHRAYDLTDSATWPWLVRMRREINGGVIREVNERGIVFEDAKYHGVLSYRVTDKTLIEVGDARSLAELKPQMTVFVAPRLLPNGQAMARAISSTHEGAARLRERTMPTVTGTVRAVDGARRSVELDTRAGDRRVVRLANPCVVRRDGKDVPISQLRVGQWVTVHIRRLDEGEVAHRVTIGKRPKSASPKAPKPQHQ